jgi:methionine-rich copper-binding protein CopC
VKFILVAVAMAAATTAAQAHAMLEHASPGAGAALAQAPKAVVLDYSEALEPQFSSVIVKDSSGQDMTAGRVSVSASTMQVSLKPLAPGTYRVAWHAVSVDSHRTEGAFSFSVMR